MSSDPEPEGRIRGLAFCARKTVSGNGSILHPYHGKFQYTIAYCDTIHDISSTS